jgi:hypothetical protein
MKSKILSMLLTLVLVLSFNLVMAVPAAAQTATVEVSLPVQVTSNSYYERGQSIVYDGTDYWLFYGRSATVTVPYATGNPDVHDYVVYYKKATTVAGLASATATAISGVAHNSNSYLGETGAAYFGSEVWAFATIDVGATAELYGWYTTDGSTWTEVGPIVSSLSDGQAHHDEVAFGGELWVAEGSGNFTTMHSATPDIGGWSTPLNVDGALTGGLVHFFVDSTDLYLAINAAGMNYIYKYNSGTVAWDKVDEDAPPNRYDPTLFKVDSTYVFAQAPWDGTKQYILEWSGATLDGTFFTASSNMVTEGAHGSNPWVGMWPIGFTDAGGTSYLFYTSERNPNDASSEIDGNIWYLTVDWDLTNDHHTYIQEAIDAPASTTINVAAGTYAETGQIVIDKDLTIVGEDPATTIIKPTANTGSAGDSRGWFLVDPGIEFHLSNVTLDGTGFLVYQGIRHKGSGSIQNVDFKEIRYNESGPTYSGVAVAAFGTGPVDVSSCSFEGIGRIGILYFALGGTSTFSGNTYTGKGDGDWLDYALDISAGAVVDVDGNTISGNRGVASSDGSTSAGILVTTLYGGGTEATISGNSLTNNTTGIMVGYDGSDASLAEVHCNNIYGNTASGVYTTAQVVDAENNWWGHASGPGGLGPGTGDAVNANVDYDPWLGSSLIGVKTETVTDDTVDAKIEADTEVAVTGTGEACAAKYASNPNPGSGFGGDIGEYIDVHVDDTTAVTQVEIRMYYTGITGIGEPSLRLHWWNGMQWVPCSDTGVNTTDVNGYGGYMWANISSATTPDLAYLSGGPFGAGAPGLSVGGIVTFPAGGSDSSSPPYAVIIGGAMAALAALGSGGWFVRRRRLRGYN